MTLATKNGSLIVQDGKIAENCGCCGGWVCSTGTCVDLSTGECSLVPMCDCVGDTKLYGGDWSGKAEGCAQCAMLLPYNVSVTMQYSGPPFGFASPSTINVLNGQRVISPWTCNGSNFSTLMQLGSLPIVWVTLTQDTWGWLSFNYEQSGGRLRQVVWFIRFGMLITGVNSDFHYKITHDCNPDEPSWDWIKGLSVTFDQMSYAGAPLSGATLSVVVNTFDELRKYQEGAPWITRC